MLLYDCLFVCVKSKNLLSDDVNDMVVTLRMNSDFMTHIRLYYPEVRPITRSTVWTNTVGNRFRQKGGEIEVFRTLEIGVAKFNPKFQFQFVEVGGAN